MSRPISAKALDFKAESSRKQLQRDIHLSNIAPTAGPVYRRDGQSRKSLEVLEAFEDGRERDSSESDDTILGVAIPKITDQSHSLNDVGWYGSAYLVTTCAFMPSFGQLYSMFSIKWVYLTSLALFEVGSLICGAAPSSVALIVGRAIAGIGCAGVGLGSLIVISHTVPLQRRPAFTGLVGGMHGIASAIGPVAGGILTDKLSWRWCLYINLPLRAIALIIVAVVLKDSGPKSGPVGLLDRLKRIDLVGTALLIPAVICLVLGLQWGGSVYAWKDAKIVALIVLGILLALGFATIQVRKGETSGIPPRILVKRSVTCATLFNICCNSAFLLPTYYLPIWFQLKKWRRELLSRDSSNVLEERFSFPWDKMCLLNNLAAGLQVVAPSIDSKLVANTGATNIGRVVSAEDSSSVLLVYNAAITSTIYVSVTLGILSVLGSTLIEWKSVKIENASDKG